jgi:pyruvate/2-oxoglutarate dehydrogenase complex dihydrolipoamide acyltransferase (E2) component
MPTKVLVPLLGEGVEEVTVTKWLKQEGETVTELEPLLEVNTDKVDTEIPAPAAGTLLKIVTPEGTPARVGEVLALIGKPGEAQGNEEVIRETVISEAVSGKAAGGTPADTARPAPAHAPGGRPHLGRELGFISPLVARMAAEHDLDLRQVAGSGLGGRITKHDVLKFLENRGQAASPQPAAAGPIGGPGDRLVRHTTIRRQIAEHMVLSKRTSPHVLTVMEADLSRVAAHRRANRGAFERDGVKLTFTAYFIAAIVAGLKAYPLVNSSWSDEGVLIRKDINIGMATSLGEDGLIVPVIKGADNLSLLAIARAVNDLATRARAKKLQPDEVRGGTFTLTNHGVSGSLFAFPVINQPQCGILGVGAMQKRPVVVSDPDGNDALAIRPMVYLSFVFDHRILDGASADWFLAKVKDTLETWS